MTRISAHDLLTTRDCVFPGCDREADRGTTYCRAHEPATKPPAPPAADDPMPQCSRPGCAETAISRAANRWRLCEAHTQEERQKASAAASRSNSTRARTATTAPKPTVADPTSRSAPTAATPQADRAVRLAQVAVEIDSTRERLLELQSEALRLLDEIREGIGL